MLSTAPEPANNGDSDAWLFGWDTTPGIVSVWADRSGRALVWQRDGDQVVCHEDRFRPWLFAANLDDLAHLGSALVAQSDAQGDSAAYSYRELEGPGDSYCYLVSASSGRALERAIVTGASRRLNKTVESIYDLARDYCHVGPVEQYLMATGRVYFRGMAYPDLHRLQFDLETTGLDAKRSRIFLVAVRDSRGFSTLLEAPTPADEPRLIEDLCALIRQRDPDVIENHNLFGFDLPFLASRAQEHNLPLALARSDGPPFLERHEEPGGYQRGKRVRYSLAGRELVDTLDAVRRHDFSVRDMPGYGLKVAARYFGVAAPERTYIPGAQIYATYLRDPDRVRRYAFDDVIEVDGLSQRLMGAPFALAGMAPRPYGRVASAGPAMGILEPMLVRAYLHAGAALPRQSADAEVGMAPHTGGATILYAAGVARQVVKADIASMYPSIMRTFKIGPECDHLGVLLSLVGRLTDLRLAHKAAARTAIPDSAEAHHHNAVHSAMKIVINAAYGYMGAGPMALFADRKAADSVTSQGRTILGQVVDELRRRGMALLEADTDGVFFAVPDGWTEDQERACVAAVALVLPSGIKLEYEGRYQAMLSHEVKNYALLTYGGELIVRGVALRTSRAEPFGERFLLAAIRCTLTGDVAGLRQVYLETVAALRERRYEARDVATLARLAKTPEEYLASRARLKEASYEALLAAGRTKWRVGERVRFYRAQDGRSIWLPDEPDDGGVEGDAATQNNPSFAVIDEIADAHHDYDIPHYLRVLHTTYVSRLRKAFAPEDYDQVFRSEGQLGLFDQPIDSVEPLWIRCT